MPINRKIALLQVALIVVFISITLIMAHWVWGQNYLSLEQEEIRDNRARVDMAWEEELSILTSLVGDWSPWDDLYDFAYNPENKGFIEKNLPNSSMANLKVNVAFVADCRGDMVFAKAIELDSRTEMLLPLEIQSQVKQIIQSGLINSDSEQALSGFIMTGQGPMLLAIQPILTSDRTGSSPGYFLFGKLADEKFLRQLSRRTQVEVSFLTLQSTPDGRLGTPSVDQQVNGDDSITAFHKLQDVFGRDGYYLAIKTPRQIFAQWQIQMRSFLLLVSGFGLLLIVITLLALERIILARLRQISDFMTTLTKDGNLSMRLTMGGSDELAQTANVINHMLRQIEETQQALRHMSMFDSLTGLYNRAWFEQEIAAAGEKRARTLGIVCCDLDGLKLINDTLGHDAGDRLLVQAAQIIRDAFPAGVAARIGGDEFAVVLYNISKEEIEAGCLKIKSQGGLQCSEHALGLHLSVGWRYDDSGKYDKEVVESLIKQADDFMYRNKLSSSQSNRSAIVQGMLEMLHVRDFITEGHSSRLRDIVTGMGEKVGLSETQLTDLCLLAQFHDIGKIGVADSILFKPGKLDSQEQMEMKRHSEIGHRIAQAIPELLPIAGLILKHHEWWNGGGYPLGLKGEAIPVEDRILAIADAYDAMTNDRPYRSAMTEAEAIAELRRCAGIQFDPQLVEIFMTVLSANKQAG